MRAALKMPDASPASSLLTEAIVAWFRSTGLRPYLNRLPAAQQRAFLAAYQARIAEAYPPRGGDPGDRTVAGPRTRAIKGVVQCLQPRLRPPAERRSCCV